MKSTGENTLALSLELAHSSLQCDIGQHAIRLAQSACLLKTTSNPAKHFLELDHILFSSCRSFEAVQIRQYFPSI